MGDFTKMLRIAVRSYIEAGNSLESVNSLWGYSINSNQKKILKNMIDLLINTDYINFETKEYLCGKRYSEVLDEVQELEGNPDIKLSTVRSRISFQLGRVKQDLGGDILDQIKKNPDNKELLKFYFDKIALLKKKEKSKSLLDGFGLKVPAYKGILVQNLNAYEMEQLEDILKHYGKGHLGKRHYQKIFSERMVSYIRYLESNEKKLSQEEEAIYKRYKAYHHFTTF